jgi:hypothetical protein
MGVVAVLTSDLTLAASLASSRLRREASCPEGGLQVGFLMRHLSRRALDRGRACAQATNVPRATNAPAATVRQP